MNELEQLYSNLVSEYDSPEEIGTVDNDQSTSFPECRYCVGGALLDYSRELWAGECNDYTSWYQKTYTEQWASHNAMFPNDSELAWGIRYIYKELTKGEIELDVSFANWIANQITEYNDDGEFGQAWDIVHTLFNKEEFKQLQLEWEERRNMFKETGVL